MATFHVELTEDAICARFTPPLIAGHLLRRYKRFLADVRLADGSNAEAYLLREERATGLPRLPCDSWRERP